MPVVREVCTQEPEDLPQLRGQDYTGAGGEIASTLGLAIVKLKSKKARAVIASIDEVLPFEKDFIDARNDRLVGYCFRFGYLNSFGICFLRFDV
jgi:hypothetical protein